MAEDFVEVAITGFFVTLILLLFPWRRERDFVIRTVIDATPERIREAYRIDPANRYSMATHPKVTAAEWLDESRLVQRFTSGSNENATVIQTVTLLDEPPWRLALHPDEIDGKPKPFGPEAFEALLLEPGQRGTATTVVWSGETSNLFQLLALRYYSGRYVRKLKRVCESPEPPVAAAAPENTAKGGMPWKSIAMSVAAVAAFSWMFGWIFGLLLCGILLLHEFGHWLAMRMTGQPAPRMMLVPFLGGIAVGNHPHKTLFHDAFCSLMGPGFSVVPCLSLAVLAYAIVPGENSFGWALELEGMGTGADITVFVSLALAMMIALLNMLQMLPVLPLDGGQILRAVLQSFGAGWARWILLALTGGGIYLLLDAGDYVLAAVLGLGLLQAWHLGGERSPAVPMRLPGLATIGLGYAGAWAAYVGVIVYAGWLFGVDLVSAAMGELVVHPALQAYDY